MWVVYASKDYKETELARKTTKKEAEAFKCCIEGCEKLSGYEVIIREE
jgi:hypothetical protein